MYHKRLARHIVNHFVPTEHNGFIPHLLRGRAIGAILGVGVGLFVFSQILHTTGYLNIAAEVYPTAIVSLTNKDRVAHGLQPLSINPTLEAAARLKAQDMVTNGYFAHTSPQGVTPWHWFAQTNYTFLYAGENLAINFDESADVEKAWLNSPTHRANILSPNFTEIGIATAPGRYNDKPTTYVVQLFGMPAVTKKTIALGTPSEIAATPTRTDLSQPIATVPPDPITPQVAGESVQQVQQPELPTLSVATIEESESFVVVKNTDERLEAQVVTPTEVPNIPWYERIILNADVYIAIIIQGIIVALILAMAGLMTREYEKHHYKHMTYGLFLSVFLVSLLFVGRIGVFAEVPQPINEIVLRQ
ncbi:MAG: hypothetical protein KBD54_01555 [Candidatus Pacebacteria bacterium]|nr:hypothetical protein [Candidatus Paceibacterota bacterium]